MRLPVHVEGIAVEQEAHQFAAQCGEQAGGCAEQAKFGATGADQQLAFGAQCTQQRALANALVQRGYLRSQVSSYASFTG